MMKQIKKLIPAIALVSFIGIALANQGQQDLCTAPGTQGYGTSLDMNAAPGALSNKDIVKYGQFETNFVCVGNTPKACHWVYDSEEADPTQRWKQCDGEYQLITP